MTAGSPQVLGIVNITEDSFSDGGLYLRPERAIEQALRLVADGADAIDLGPASSHPDAKPVAAEEEVRRLAPVVERLLERGVSVSIDSFRIETQRWALERGVAYLNDIQGFPDPAIYPEIARSRSRLIVMHSVQGRGRATRVETEPSGIVPAILRFFDQRLAALEAAGVGRDRIIVDPGMGFFLGASPEPSLAVLASLGAIRERLGLPVLVSVSRKSFLRAITGRGVSELGAATVAAELHAASQGADWIRTHDVRALRDALAVASALAS